MSAIIPSALVESHPPLVILGGRFESIDSLRGLESNLRLGGTAEGRALPFHPLGGRFGRVVLEANSRFLALLGMTMFNLGRCNQGKHKVPRLRSG
jgi:hypothetical protein